MPGRVRIHKEILVRLLEVACKTPDEECCGLLAGRNGFISEILPAKNGAAKRATRFEVAPAELFELMRRIRSSDMQLLGIYHSHPTGENRPSPTDIDQAYYPDVVYFVISPNPSSTNPVRAFSIREGEVTELRLEFV